MSAVLRQLRSQPSGRPLLSCSLLLARAPQVFVSGHTRKFIEELQRAVFCAVLPGNGWGHIEEPILQAGRTGSTTRRMTRSYLIEVSSIQI